MAKKLKDWYDEAYLKEIASKLLKVFPEFNDRKFYALTVNEIEKLEFGQRQVLIADALKQSIDLSYEETIDFFTRILGPELPDNNGNFTEGYWLWPIGKYVELNGLENIERSLSFSKELTKRFTSEYCMRPLIACAPEKIMPLLIEWSQDDHVRVRRLSSECIRIRLPWTQKMTIALEYFEEYQQILFHLKDDPDKFIQKSVANNLNDLYKESPEHFYEIIQQWQREPMTKETEWIIQHGSRSLKKMR